MSNLPATAQPLPRRPYSQLSEAEKWDWHADVYAFRRVQLEVSDDERKSPCDPDGVWFDEPRVEAKTKALRARLECAARSRRAAADAGLIREGRDICNRWARSLGFVDFAAAERAGHGFSSVLGAIGEDRRAAKGFASIGAALGVRAREFTSDQLAAGRAELGLSGDGLNGAP